MTNIPLVSRPSAIIQTFSDGSFQESETGFEALLLPIRDAHGEVIDICAWQIGEPYVWWRHKCLGDILGAEAVSRAAWEPRELVIYETPAKWLAALSPIAVCILDWSADLRAIFGILHGPITCESERLEQKFLQTLARQRGPDLGGKIRLLA